MTTHAAICHVRQRAGVNNDHIRDAGEQRVFSRVKTPFPSLFSEGDRLALPFSV